LARGLAWQERRLEFVAAPLAEVVAEFNRYNRMQLIVEGAGLAAERFGGSFRADQPDTLVRLLETRFGLRAERRGNETILRAGVPGTP
jgi:transmembrane sensor